MENKILKLGKYEIDISDLSHAREEKAKGKWSRVFKEGVKVKSAGYYNKHVNKIGSYLINQDLYILKRSLSLGDAIKELLLRRFILTSFYLNRLENKEYEAFESFIYKTITGKTLEDLEKEKEDSLKKNDIMAIGIQTMDQIDHLGISLETCMESFQTWLSEQVTSGNISPHIQQKQ